MKTKAWKFLSLLFIAIFASSTFGMVHAQSVTATITVGSGPTLIAYDSGKGEIFVVNWIDSTISVISDSTNKVVATINMASAPTPTYSSDSIAYDSSKGEMLVETFATSNGNSNSISVISDSTNKVVSTINIGSTVTYPQNQGIAYDSAKNEVFMANGGTETADTVSVISLSSTATGSSPTPKVPEFSNAALILIATAIAAVTLTALVLARKKQQQDDYK